MNKNGKENFELFYILFEKISKSYYAFLYGKKKTVSFETVLYILL